MKKFFLLTIILLLVTGIETMPQVHKNKWQFGFGGSYLKAIGDIPTGEMQSFGFYASIQADITERFSMRLRPFYRMFEMWDYKFTPTDPKSTMMGGDIDLLWNIWPCEPIVPYFGVGASFYNLTVEDAFYFADPNYYSPGTTEESTLDYQLNFLFGLNWRLSPDWSVVTEFGYHNLANDKIDGTWGDLNGGMLGGNTDAYASFNLGLLVAFGHGEASDICNPQICPEVDYDRIEDMIRRHKPEPVEVDYDRIEDIVKRHKTVCPEDEGDGGVLVGIRFDFDKCNIKPEFIPVLNATVEIMNSKQNSGKSYVIQGHTDHIGSDAYNKKLSLKRAESVKDYLVKNGVAASRLSVEGLGEAYPIADNKTAEGRALNRRVEYVAK